MPRRMQHTLLGGELGRIEKTDERHKRLEEETAVRVGNGVAPDMEGAIVHPQTPTMPAVAVADETHPLIPIVLTIAIVDNAAMLQDATIDAKVGSRYGSVEGVSPDMENAITHPPSSGSP
jgi:hypothetical protein